MTEPRKRIEPPTLTLHAESLCSKWGFNDCDIPQSIEDYWDEIGLRVFSIDWHGALTTLVREHLVPAMEAAGYAVELTEISTIHNPIRARTINGVEVDPYNVGAGEDIDVSVTVPYAAIARACGLQEE